MTVEEPLADLARELEGLQADGKLPRELQIGPILHLAETWWGIGVFEAEVADASPSEALAQLRSLSNAIESLERQLEALSDPAATALYWVPLAHGSDPVLKLRRALKQVKIMTLSAEKKLPPGTAGRPPSETDRRVNALARELRHQNFDVNARTTGPLFVIFRTLNRYAGIRFSREAQVLAKALERLEEEPEFPSPNRNSTF